MSSPLTNETTIPQTELEQYFDAFRCHIVGIDQTFETPFGIKKIVYADWTASGRLYAPIEKVLLHKIAPFVGNTHTETTVTGSSMTLAYHEARDVIKRHVGAHRKDVLISSNAGMTGVVNKFQRILGMKIHEKYMPLIELPDELRPVVFVTHMEHHSNQTSWLETTADVEVIKANAQGLVCLDDLRGLLQKYAKRKTKIAAITSCSNVTGVFTPYHDIAELMHQHGGLCFVDFACSAPYIDINMRPENELRHLDAIFFSPHKFLGGPGSTGVLIFDPKLYKNKIPDNPGGGTVDWTNPWGGHRYIEEIEAREDGGTPAFLQTMRVALAIRLKEKMGVQNILAREHEILQRLWAGLRHVPKLHILAPSNEERLGVISFFIEGLHYNLGVKLLNDRYGIQMRGGCSCAGTYGHYLLNVDQYFSKKITTRIDIGDLSAKPGWIRMSIHPTMTTAEVDYIVEAVRALADNATQWADDYTYDIHTNEFQHKNFKQSLDSRVKSWFSKDLLS